MLFLLVNVNFAQKEKKEEKAPYLERDSLYQKHSPRKAILLSAALPGAGQVYNKKVWKAPIVWLGMGTCVAFIGYNTKIYKELKQDYIALNDNDPNTINISDVPPQLLEEEMGRFRKYKEISYVALAGVYLLNLLDAYVDGYLFHFDIDESLSAGINPSMGLLNYQNNTEGYLGMKITIALK